MKRSSLSTILSVTTIIILLITGSAFGDDALYIDEDGNVGIGTTSPNSILDIGDTGYITISGYSNSLISGVNHGTILGPQSRSIAIALRDNEPATDRFSIVVDPDGNCQPDTEAFIVRGDGHVGIGTNSPGSLLTVEQDQADMTANMPLVSLTASGTATSTKGEILHLYSTRGTGTDDSDLFLVAGGSSGFNTYFTVRNTGNVGIGTTSPDAIFNVQGGTDVGSSLSLPGYIVIGDLQGVNIGIDNNEIMARSNGSISSLYIQYGGGDLYLKNTWYSSDLQLKENVNTLGNSLNKISKLRGVSFEWIDKSKDEKQHMGLIAQEVEEVFPELVETDDDGNKAVAYIDLIAPIIESVKELKAENESLVEIITELEDRIAKLEKTH